MRIKGFGEKGQKKLKSTSVLVAGAGGLGSNASVYLAMAGVGNLKIVDNDVVELSNLNRQILYREGDIGRNKAKVASNNLKRLNRDVSVESFNCEINEKSVEEIVGGCDLIVDCLDNYETRYILNEVSVKQETPLFHAAVRGLDGQTTTIIPGETPCLKCIIPSPPAEEKIPVLGATPGLLACIQAQELIKYVVGAKVSLKNKLLIVSRGAEFEALEIKKNPSCEVCSSKK
ncbi:hypothetical protein AKJ41_03740 [candidate division MSBL1 archaeon SCGC-AAA259O05]|uniref:THIF-type NAD/FAD binding fold domain-containing protein n=1 Tax=candidate division MSBL1 archaeon SCGC-AAA259O05 TaxID=1698271 RepID=A0A133V2T4_9EURY|nr:hypothetical protein AKJ41_03740 [candidate division MSBL1 archaeon SCGC-AAA259O05]